MHGYTTFNRGYLCPDPAREQRARHRITRGEPDRLLGRVYRLVGSSETPETDLRVYVSGYTALRVRFGPVVNGIPDDRDDDVRTRFLQPDLAWTLFETLLDDVLEEA